MKSFSLCLCVSVVKIFSALSARSAVNPPKANGAARATPPTTKDGF